MKYISIIAALVFFSACEFDLNNDLGLGEYERELVVNAVITPGLNPSVEITQSSGILENAVFTQITAADVSLISDGRTYIMDLDDDNRFSTELAIIPNRQYELRIALPGQGTIEAIERVPQSIQFETLRIEDTVSISDFGILLSEVDFSFQDPGGVENFYELLIFQVSEEGRVEFLPMRSNNISIENSGAATVIGSGASDFINQALISDRLTDGQLQEMEIQILRAYPNQKVYVFLKSLPSTYYHYLLNLNAADENEDNPFTEQISIPSNIEGALGIFAAYTSVLDSIG